MANTHSEPPPQPASKAHQLQLYDPHKIPARLPRGSGLSVAQWCARPACAQPHCTPANMLRAASAAPMFLRQYDQCGGLGGTCPNWGCRDAQWEGCTCRPGCYCQRINAWVPALPLRSIRRHDLRAACWPGVLPRRRGLGARPGRRCTALLGAVGPGRLPNLPHLTPCPWPLLPLWRSYYWQCAGEYWPPGYNISTYGPNNEGNMNPTTNQNSNPAPSPTPLPSPSPVPVPSPQQQQQSPSPDVNAPPPALRIWDQCGGKGGNCAVYGAGACDDKTYPGYSCPAGERGALAAGRQHQLGPCLQAPFATSGRGVPLGGYAEPAFGTAVLGPPGPWRASLLPACLPAPASRRAPAPALPPPPQKPCA
jgi:hypothetical protein